MGIIYYISDSTWVSLVQVVPKKGMSIVKNEKNELIPTRIVTWQRVCIDYRILNDNTKKDHYPLPFIDQMLEQLSGQAYYCFLDGYSWYNQIAIRQKIMKRLHLLAHKSLLPIVECPLGYAMHFLHSKDAWCPFFQI